MTDEPMTEAERALLYRLDRFARSATPVHAALAAEREARAAAERDVVALVEVVRRMTVARDFITLHRDNVVGGQVVQTSKVLDLLEEALEPLANPAAAEPALLPSHPDDGHDHHFTCIRCGVNPAEPSGLPASDAVNPQPHGALEQPAEPRWPSGPEAERELQEAMLATYAERSQPGGMPMDEQARALLAALQEKRDPGE